MKKISDNRKINICIFSGDISRPGGTERVAVFLANRLSENSLFHISIVSITESEQKPSFEIDSRIPRYTLSKKWVAPGPAYIRIIYRLYRLIREKKFDLIIDVDTVLDILALPCKWLTGIKVISWEHCNFSASLGTVYRSWCRKAACRFSDYIVTLTERDAAMWREQGHPRCPVQAIHNPSNHMASYNENLQREKIILSAGWLVPLKGFEDVILAASKIVPLYPEWKFYIVGKGQEEEKLLQMIRDYHLEDHVFLKGFVEDMAVLYQKASIYLMTSRVEGLPMVLLEAKYFRLPTVSYDILTGPSDIILDNINGYLVPPQRIDLLIERLCQLISDENLRASFSRHAWDNIKDFDQDVILAQWTELLEKLCP